MTSGYNHDRNQKYRININKIRLVQKRILMGYEKGILLFDQDTS